MANFQAQVEGLTSLTVSTTPTTTELTQFLTDGAREIINILPSDLLQYCVDYTELNSSSAMNIGTDTDIGKVMFVTHYDGDRYLPARSIPAAFSSLSNDSTSLKYFGTDSDPVYWIISDGTNPGLEVFPTPTATKKARVHHIAYPAVAYGDSDIDNFPDNAEYLVALYAATKTLMANMGAKSSDLPTFATVTPPVTPAISTVSYTDYTENSISVAEVIQGADYPTYTSPTVGGATESLTGTMTALVGDQLGTDNDFEDFSDWFTALGEMIEDDEDIELASAQIEKINSYIQTYNVAMQDKLNTFNEAAAKFQAVVQKATNDANFQMQKNLQSAQLSQQQRGQKAVQDLQASIDNNNKKLTKFQAESAVYNISVNKAVQEFTTSLQKHTTDYQWLQGRYVQLKAEYNQGIRMLISGGLPQPQQQQGR